MTEQPRMIYEAMASILADLPAIGKSAKNVQAGFASRSIDDVMDALHVAFSKHKVFVTVDVVDRSYVERETVTSSGKASVVTDARLLVGYTFWAVDGSNVTTTVAVEGRDYADKATTKALSQAFKYAMLQTFSIALSEHDGDVETIEVAPAKRKPMTPLQRKTIETKTKILDAVGGEVEAARLVWDAITSDLQMEGKTMKQLDAIADALPSYVKNATSEIPTSEYE